MGRPPPARCRSNSRSCKNYRQKDRARRSRGGGAGGEEDPSFSVCLTGETAGAASCCCNMWSPGKPLWLRTWPLEACMPNGAQWLPYNHHLKKTCGTVTCTAFLSTVAFHRCTIERVFNIHQYTYGPGYTAAQQPVLAILPSRLESNSTVPHGETLSPGRQ